VAVASHYALLNTFEFRRDLVAVVDLGSTAVPGILQAGAQSREYLGDCQSVVVGDGPQAEGGVKPLAVQRDRVVAVDAQPACIGLVVPDGSGVTGSTRTILRPSVRLLF